MVRINIPQAQLGGMRQVADQESLDEVKKAEIAQQEGAQKYRNLGMVFDAASQIAGNYLDKKKKDAESKLEGEWKITKAQLDADIATAKAKFGEADLEEAYALGPEGAINFATQAYKGWIESRRAEIQENKPELLPQFDSYISSNISGHFEQGFLKSAMSGLDKFQAEGDIANIQMQLEAAVDSGDLTSFNKALSFVSNTPHLSTSQKESQKNLIHSTARSHILQRLGDPVEGFDFAMSLDGMSDKSIARLVGPEDVGKVRKGILESRARKVRELAEQSTESPPQTERKESGARLLSDPAAVIENKLPEQDLQEIGDDLKKAAEEIPLAAHGGMNIGWIVDNFKKAGAIVEGAMTVRDRILAGEPVTDFDHDSDEFQLGMAAAWRVREEGIEVAIEIARKAKAEGNMDAYHSLLGLAAQKLIRHWDTIGPEVDPGSIAWASDLDLGVGESQEDVDFVLALSEQLSAQGRNDRTLRQVRRKVANALINFHQSRVRWALKVLPPETAERRASALKDFANLKNKDDLGEMATLLANEGTLLSIFRFFESPDQATMIEADMRKATGLELGEGTLVEKIGKAAAAVAIDAMESGKFRLAYELPGVPRKYRKLYDFYDEQDNYEEWIQNPGNREMLAARIFETGYVPGVQNFNFEHATFAAMNLMAADFAPSQFAKGKIVENPPELYHPLAWAKCQQDLRRLFGHIRTDSITGAQFQGTDEDGNALFTVQYMSREGTLNNVTHQTGTKTGQPYILKVNPMTIEDEVAAKYEYDLDKDRGWLLSGAADIGSGIASVPGWWLEGIYEMLDGPAIVGGFKWAGMHISDSWRTFGNYATSHGLWEALTLPFSSDTPENPPTEESND